MSTVHKMADPDNALGQAIDKHYERSIVSTHGRAGARYINKRRALADALANPDLEKKSVVRLFAAEDVRLDALDKGEQIDLLEALRRMEQSGGGA